MGRRRSAEEHWFWHRVPRKGQRALTQGESIAVCNAISRAGVVTKDPTVQKHIHGEMRNDGIAVGLQHDGLQVVSAMTYSEGTFRTGKSINTRMQSHSTTSRRAYGQTDSWMSNFATTSLYNGCKQHNHAFDRHRGQALCSRHARLQIWKMTDRRPVGQRCNQYRFDWFDKA